MLKTLLLASTLVLIADTAIIANYTFQFYPLQGVLNLSATTGYSSSSKTLNLNLASSTCSQHRTNSSDVHSYDPKWKDACDAIDAKIDENDFESVKSAAGK